jgi:type II secretion system protein G
MNSLRTQAFTLIELLIVVAIIAILAAIAVPNFLEAQVRSRVSRVKSDLRSLATAWEAYHVDNNQYPPDVNDIINGRQSEWGTYKKVTTPIAYITSVPFDTFQDKAILKQVKTDPLFEYWGAPDNLTSSDWVRTGTRWLMISYGPDQDWDTDGWAALQFTLFCYDPTNGTRSDGDIMRTNVRCYPQ